MSKYKVDITNLNTNNIKVLKQEEMIELFKRYQNGDLKAKDELINGNLKLVLSILKRFNKDKYNMDDLFQVGVIGLIKAIDNFDLSYNLKLSTYACPLIIGEVKRYIRDNNSLRVSRSIKDLAYQILKYKDEYLKTKGYEPKNEEVAAALGIDEYQITFALDIPPFFIGTAIDTIYLLDQIADKKESNQDKDMLISLRKAMQKIKERERNVLIERFIIGKTQMEIADALGISQAQVSRIEKNAIQNVKRLIK